MVFSRSAQVFVLRGFWALHLNDIFVGQFFIAPCVPCKMEEPKAGAEFLFAFYSMAARSHCCCNCLCRTWHLASQNERTTPPAAVGLFVLSRATTVPELWVVN